MIVYMFKLNKLFKIRMFGLKWFIFKRDYYNVFMAKKKMIFLCVVELK